jgi:hypothetical protein
MFQNFWNRDYWSYSNSVGNPEKLKRKNDLSILYQGGDALLKATLKVEIALKL